MSVKTYSYSRQGNVFVSPHTQVREFASKSGAKLYSDNVLIDEGLLLKIESLFEKLKCQKYIVTSGYRTAEHDRAVGGNGVGQHTKGKAVDCRFYDKNGKIISAKIVCCVAQDLGFTGIANISGKYQNVHLDVRENGIYKGDEIKGTNTVTDDFYKYFGISRAEVAAYTGETVAPAGNAFQKYSGATNSIVTALNSLGVDSSFEYRKKIALANGIAGYKGTASQNTNMLNLLKKGALLRPQVTK